MTMQPYYEDEEAGIYLYLGDMREVLPKLDIKADLILADPPYAETSLAWDHWPDGWPTLAATVASSMWCFGSMRMFLDRRDEFAEWKLSQDLVWEKHNGSGFAADRFRRVHEVAVHWYRGDWRSVHHSTPRVPATYDSKGRTASSRFASRTPHTGEIDATPYVDDGQRLARSVLYVKSMQGSAIHETEKPLGILDPLIRYACPEGGVVLDPFTGSGSTLDAARQSGRRAIGIEANEEYAERAKRRLSALTLPAA